MVFCPGCGTQVNDGNRFCPACGRPLEAPPVQPQAPAPKYSIKSIYGRAADVLRQKPLRLWGLSLMCTLLTSLAWTLGILPIIALPIVFALTVGMSAIYLAGLNGEDVNSDQLFKGFTKGNFFRFAGGMGWMCLWILIWGLVPIAGIVIAIIKMYEYRFVPYILLTDPDVSATEALRRSMKLSEGIRGKMFAADILIYGVILAACLVLSLFSMIPYAGVLFAIIFVLLSIAVAMFLPLFLGLVHAAFYDERSKED